MTWVVDYVVGNTYKTKYVKANNAQEAIKRARVKNIEDLYTYEELLERQAEAMKNTKENVNEH